MRAIEDKSAIAESHQTTKLYRYSTHLNDLFNNLADHPARSSATIDILLMHLSIYSPSKYFLMTHPDWGYLLHIQLPIPRGKNAYLLLSNLQRDIRRISFNPSFRSTSTILSYLHAQIDDIYVAVFAHHGVMQFKVDMG